MTGGYDPAKYAATSPPKRPHEHHGQGSLARRGGARAKTGIAIDDVENAAKAAQRARKGAGAAAALGQDGPPNSKPLLDFQTSFVYGATYPGSRGREAFENSILKPVEIVGNPPPPPHVVRAEAREYWNAHFGGADILLRDDYARRYGRAAAGVGLVRGRTSRGFEEWRAEKLRQRSEELARQEAIRREQEERAAEAQRQSARAVKSWERQKKKLAREARIEARRARRQQRKDDRRERKRRQEAEKQLESEALEALRTAVAESAEAKAARLAARAREREAQQARAQRNEEAFQAWVKTKRRQQREAALRRAEVERIKREVAEAERQRRWAKKDVVLAYSGVAEALGEA